ncbi:sulfite exporter TauE/SafE family protein [Bosea sp. (in: a-proteobacteria)]|uniref:sulfite exporter TauE/SafE family protein n=1 Tax=Bosea sp. (in: a-proteobacteria) TaxID=1871050 RepID=UPI002734E46C|nr:sulfite exporter TauE/SafE family protein [Bosea sp. (in: a-proteobacteria)]MDP3407113.1 sulfite exporter TauE/SafE family protein [Bosea sp. (in: a-proteobacteria)]
MTDLSLILFIAATFLLAGFVKGVIGLGLPTIAIGVLGVIMAPAQAAALLAVPNIVTNGWQVARGPALRTTLLRLWPMLAGIGVGTWAGAGLLEQQKGGAATLWLGVALVIYALVGLKAAKLRVPARAEGWLSPLIGVATGVATAATGVFVLPAVPYLQALGLDKDELVQALGLSFLVSTLALSIGLVGAGALDLQVAWHSALALLPALAGMAAGTMIRSRISAKTFKLCFFAGLLALGSYLVLRAAG